MTTSPALTNAFNLAYEAGENKVLELTNKLISSGDFFKSEHVADVFEILGVATHRLISDDRLDEASNIINRATTLDLYPLLIKKPFTNNIIKHCIPLAAKHRASGNTLGVRNTLMTQYEHIEDDVDGREEAHVLLEALRREYISHDMEREALNLANDIAVIGALYPDGAKESWEYIKEVRAERLANDHEKLGIAYLMLLHRAWKNSAEYKDAYAFTHELIDKYIAENNPDKALNTLETRHFSRTQGNGNSKNMTLDMCGHLSQICDLYAKNNDEDKALETLQKNIIKVRLKSDEFNYIMNDINEIRDSYISPFTENIDKAVDIARWQMHVDEEGNPMSSTHVGHYNAWGYHPNTDGFESALNALTKIGDIYLEKSKTSKARDLAIIVKENICRKEPQENLLNFLDRFQEHCIETKQPYMADGLISGKNGLRFAKLFKANGSHNKASDCMAKQIYDTAEFSDLQIKAAEALHQQLDERLAAKDFPGAEHSYCNIAFCYNNFGSNDVFSTNEGYNGFSLEKIKQAAIDIATLHIKNYGIDKSIEYAKGPDEYSNSGVKYKKDYLGSLMLGQILDIHAKNQDPEAINGLIEYASNFRYGASISSDDKVKNREKVVEMYYDNGNGDHVKTLKYAQHHYYMNNKRNDVMWNMVNTLRDVYENCENSNMDYKVKEIEKWQLQASEGFEPHHKEIEQRLAKEEIIAVKKNSFDHILAGFAGNLQDNSTKVDNSDNYTM